MLLLNIPPTTEVLLFYNAVKGYGHSFAAAAAKFTKCSIYLNDAIMLILLCHRVSNTDVMNSTNMLQLL